jgi:hypothetical protein
MSAHFFNTQGMIHREFVPEGNTVNSESYLEVLEKLLVKQNLQTKLHFQKKGFSSAIIHLLILSQE